MSGPSVQSAKLSVSITVSGKRQKLVFFLFCFLNQRWVGLVASYSFKPVIDIDFRSEAAIIYSSFKKYGYRLQGCQTATIPVCVSILVSVTLLDIFRKNSGQIGIISSRVCGN